MKISNSKKELAKIIHENGGWREGAEWAAQDGVGSDGLYNVAAYGERPVYVKDHAWHKPSNFSAYHEDWFKVSSPVNGWHQTILSRAEYFHLYPAPDAKPQFCESVTRSIPEPETKPTIEQLAADYRNAKDCADRKQQEADAAKAGAEAKLADLIAAGKALGLVLSVAGGDPELVITDWRDLREHDVIWFCGDDEQGEGEYSVLEVEHRDYGGQRTVRIDTIGNDYWIDVSDDWKFIRRP